MFTKKLASVLVFIGFFTSVAWAQRSDSAQTSKMGAGSMNQMNVNDPVGWFPFIGLAGGYMSPSDTHLTGGRPSELRLLGSHFSESRHRVFDFGFGIMTDSFSQKSTVQNNFISGGVAEVAWRYNPANRWQFGPVVDAYIGGGSRYGSTDPTWTSFGGLQLLKEFPIKGESLFRLGVKALNDLSISGSNVNMVMLDLQWGFGAKQSAPQVGQTEVIEETIIGEIIPVMEAPDMVYGGDESRRVIETDANARTLTIRDERRLQFKTGSAMLNARNREFVEMIGAAIAQRPDLYKSIEVVGFADQTGTDAINMKISEARALFVGGLLRQGGLDNSKVVLSWKGASEPLYQSLLPEDLQQNRRVDIIFHGVANQDELSDYLSSLL